jgi:hypothetical protein
MPVSALVLVHRVVMPAARARYRSHGGTPAKSEVSRVGMIEA